VSVEQLKHVLPLVGAERPPIPPVRPTRHSLGDHHLKSLRARRSARHNGLRSSSAAGRTTLENG
jgi:hypothetical protein